MKTIEHDPFWTKYEETEAGWTDYIGFFCQTKEAGGKEVKIRVAMDHDGEGDYVMITEEIFDGEQNLVLRGIEIPLGGASEAVYRIIGQKPKAMSEV